MVLYTVQQIEQETCTTHTYTHTHQIECITPFELNKEQPNTKTDASKPFGKTNDLFNIGISDTFSQKNNKTCRSLKRQIGLQL